MSKILADDTHRQAKRSLRSRLLGLAVVCLLVAGILLFAVFSNAKSRWYCSPSQPRTSGEHAWEKVTAPAQSPGEPNEAFYANFTVSSDEQNFIVEYPVDDPVDNPFDYEIRRMTPGDTIEIGGGTFAFCAVGTAYLNATQTMEDDAVYRFFDEGLQNVTAERADELGILQLAEPGRNFRYSPYPSVQFEFRNENIEDLVFHGIKIFDASTRKELAGGYSSSGGQTYHRFSTRIPLWHRTPIDIVLDVSYGPSKTFDFAPRVGEGFREGNFECRLIAVLEGVDVGGWSSSSRGKTATYEFRKAPPDKAGLRFFFVCQPTASKMPVTFDCLDADGNPLSGRGSSTSGNTHSISTKHPLEKIARIRARYRTRRERILIHLPYIPGLPEQNNKIEDLFDVHVPYVRLHDDAQVSDFLLQVLQLSSGRRTGSVPSNSINSIRFPVEFRDATVREIAQLYAEGGKLRVDMENERLILEYPVPLGTKLRQWLDQMFRRR